MFLVRDFKKGYALCFPRVSGDVSERRNAKFVRFVFSPRERGCFQSAALNRCAFRVFPA